MDVKLTGVNMEASHGRRKEARRPLLGWVSISPTVTRADTGAPLAPLRSPGYLATPMPSAASVEAPPSIPERVHEAISRLVGKPLFWLAVVLAVGSWPLVWSLRSPLPPPLPVLASLPPFELTDQQGKPYGSKDLEGRVWVASFIFTRCVTVCPAITAQMARIQARTSQLMPAFRLVSISVDPDYDTPERLHAYARAHRATPRAWTFLTGPAGKVKDTVVNGLKVAMGTEKGEDGAEEIFHGSHLVLVDQRGRVRAYYDSGEEKVVDRVVRDAALLVNRGY